MLDLDTTATYANIFDEILYANDVWPVLDSYFNDSHGKIGELFSDTYSINDLFLRKLQHNCENLFLKKYTYVTAYHACCTDSPEQYLQLGLLTATQLRLEAKAREIFFGMVGLEEAIIGARSYFTSYGDSLHMYISAEFAAIEYLEKGCFYLRRVAADLGGEERLMRQGKPVFVKCKIPVSWLQDSCFGREYRFLYRYVSSLMRRCIWARACPSERYCEPPETLAIFKAVPPDNVLEILDASVCNNWREMARRRKSDCSF